MGGGRLMTAPNGAIADRRHTGNTTSLRRRWPRAVGARRGRSDGRAYARKAGDLVHASPCARAAGQGCAAADFGLRLAASMYVHLFPVKTTPDARHDSLPPSRGSPAYLTRIPVR